MSATSGYLHAAFKLRELRAAPDKDNRPSEEEALLNHMDHVWARMSPEERQAVEAALDAEAQPTEAQPTEAQPPTP